MSGRPQESSDRGLGDRSRIEVVRMLGAGQEVQQEW